MRVGVDVDPYSFLWGQSRGREARTDFHVGLAKLFKKPPGREAHAGAELIDIGAARDVLHRDRPRSPSEANSPAVHVGDRATKQLDDDAPFPVEGVDGTQRISRRDDRKTVTLRLTGLDQPVPFCQPGAIRIEGADPHQQARVQLGRAAMNGAGCHLRWRRAA